jgi:hypothetical protein
VSLDATDLVGAFIDEQARVNSALDEGDVNNLVADFSTITGETIGFQSDSISTVAMATPHTWNDGIMEWNFFQWLP